MSTCAMYLNSSAARCCDVPTPAWPYESLPGCALASATSSATVLTGSSGGTASTFAAMNTCEIGAKSLRGSNGSVSYRLGLMTSDELPPISNVVPSAVALATRSVATLLPAPGTFSTTNGVPQTSE